MKKLNGLAKLISLGILIAGFIFACGGWFMQYQFSCQTIENHAVMIDGLKSSLDSIDKRLSRIEWKLEDMNK